MGGADDYGRKRIYARRGDEFDRDDNISLFLVVRDRVRGLEEGGKETLNVTSMVWRKTLNTSFFIARWQDLFGTCFISPLTFTHQKAHLICLILVKEFCSNDKMSNNCGNDGHVLGHMVE